MNSRSFRSAAAWLTVALLLFYLSGSAWSAEETPSIAPEDARQHVGKRVAVTFVVKASKDAKHRKTIFLDSEENFMDEKNLGIAISEQGAAELKSERNIAAPAEYFLQKRVRVTGTVVLRDERCYIDVDQAAQIEEITEGGE